MKGFLRAWAIILLMLVAVLTFTRRENSGWIAFTSFRSGDAAVYLMSVQGGEARQISPQGVCGYAPEWSPDGRWISFRDFCSFSTDIMRVRPSGLGFEAIPTELGAIEIIRWSPDGQWLLTSSGNSDLHVMRTDGSSPRLLDEQTYYPQWSPDSQWIYTVPILNEDSGFNRISVETGRIEDLLPPFAAINDWGFSPDGKTIVMALANEEELGNGLFLMEPDGSNIRMIRKANTPEAYYEPIWSGEWIAFIAGASNADRHIYRIRPDGSNLEEISQQAGTLTNLRWSSDGEWLIFAADYDGKENIFRLRTDGSSQKNLTADQDYNSQSRVAPIAGLDWHPLPLILAALGMIFASLVWRFRA